MKILLTSDTHYGHDKNTHRIHEKWLPEIAKEKPDVVIHAGDWTSTKQDQFYKTMRMFREAFGNTQILTVRGNHDFWGMEKDTFYQHSKWFLELNIRHIDIPFENDGIIIMGFDGWYHDPNPLTNDLYWMGMTIDGKHTHDYLSKAADRDLNNILDIDTSGYKKSICVTHFPPFSSYGEEENPYGANPKYMDLLCDKFDILCLGHSHQKSDFIHKKCRVLNAGSDYNQPKYIIFEV